MSKFTKILISLLVVMYTSSVLFAQVSSAQSRLNIGSNPTAKLPTNTGIGNAPAIVKVSNEIKVDKNAALNEFYKDLLLKGSGNKVSIPNSVIANEVTSDDHLYDNEIVEVSNIYPNPANDYATLNYRYRNTQKRVKISFINILGTSIGDFDLNPGDNKLQVNTRTWDNGIYFYQLMIEGKKVATKKLIVRHQ